MAETRSLRPASSMQVMTVRTSARPDSSWMSSALRPRALLVSDRGRAERAGSRPGCGRRVVAWFIARTGAAFVTPSRYLSTRETRRQKGRGVIVATR